MEDATILRHGATSPAHRRSGATPYAPTFPSSITSYRSCGSLVQYREPGSPVIRMDGRFPLSKLRVSGPSRLVPIWTRPLRGRAGSWSDRPSTSSVCASCSPWRAPPKRARAAWAVA